MSTAAVVGGTGLVGSHLARLLAGDSGYERVLSLTRRATGLTLPGLDERVIDFERLAGDPETFDPIECDSAFCTLGTTIKVAGSEDAFRRVDLDYVEAFARAARVGGARRFLMVSSIGADAASRNFYLSVKGRAEDAVRAAGFESGGVFRPGVLLGERAEKRPLAQ